MGIPELSFTSNFWCGGSAVLKVTAATVILVTIAEILLLPLFPLPGASRWYMAGMLAVFNLLIALVSGYLVISLFSGPRGRGNSGDTLAIVYDTLPVLRRGLNPQTAAKTAGIIGKLQDVRGVLISDRERVLAVHGHDFDHPAWSEAVTRRVTEALSRRPAQVVRLHQPAVNGRPAASVVVVPLRVRDQVVGTLGLVGEDSPQPATDMVRMARTIGQLLTMQIELGQLDRQTQLATEAELSALRAQINPHFLFNTLNTMISYTRDDPETTRRLLFRLAGLLRTKVHATRQLVSFAEEYQAIKDYLYIEQARFPDKLRVIYEVDPQVMKVSVPAFSVQPLVENAVRHAITPKIGPGTVQLIARLDFLSLRVHITVKDDGVGMPSERVQQVLRPRPHEASNVGLSNINERLKRLYGKHYSLRIDSQPGRGTTVQMRIPMR